MSGTWLEFSTSCANSLRPFHAGMTVDLIDNNLDSMASEGFWDLTSAAGNAAVYSCAASTGWQWFSTCGPLDVIIRPVKGGTENRTYTIGLEGRCSTGAAKVVHVRAYLWEDGRYFNRGWCSATDALGVYPGYGEFTFSTSTFEAFSTTVSGANIYPEPVPSAAVYTDAAVSEQPLLDCAYLVFATSSAEATKLILRNVRIAEIGS
jgi:hypothetical protein